ncbi:Gfo/Idh/MocA family protein [Shewanella sp.]|uniref:Gfo/Idh/MocA family protein n=1 Tax=Shewanella sp. TaxID=50422 RepID=UPI004053EB3A
MSQANTLSPLKWGILGSSFISAVMADAILAEGNTVLYAVAGRSAAPLNEFADKYKITTIYHDYDALINDPLVDIVYIALPNHLHHEYVIKAAHAGKAILCEKSLSIDMEKTEACLKAVKDSGVFFAEGLMYLTHPLAANVADIIASGVIGQVKAIQGQYCAAISQFVNPDSMGTLYNLGCYPVSLMHLVLQTAFGDDIFDSMNIKAIGRQGTDGNICDTSAVFAFTPTQNAPVLAENLTTESIITPITTVQCQLHTAEDYGLHSRFNVLGTKGSLNMDTNPWLPENHNRLSVTQFEQASEVIDVSATGNGFYYQVQQIRQAIEQKQLSLMRPAVRPQDSYTIMKLLTQWQNALVV